MMNNRVDVVPRTAFGKFFKTAGRSVLAGAATAGAFRYLIDPQGTAQWQVGPLVAPLWIAQGLLVGATTLVGNIIQTSIVDSPNVGLPPFIRQTSDKLMGPLITGGMLAAFNAVDQRGDLAPGPWRDIAVGFLASNFGQQATLFARQSFPILLG